MPLVTCTSCLHTSTSLPPLYAAPLDREGGYIELDSSQIPKKITSIGISYTLDMRF